MSLNTDAVKAAITQAIAEATTSGDIEQVEILADNLRDIEQEQGNGDDN